FNSATLGTLGIGHDTPDPPGGRYGRVPGSEVLDGRLTEYAWWNARRRLSSSVPDSASRADLLRYADAAARFGITTVQDMNNNLTTARAVALLRDADVPIRWRVIRFPMTRAGGRDVADARAAGRFGGHVHPRRHPGRAWCRDAPPVRRPARLVRRARLPARDAGRDHSRDARRARAVAGARRGRQRHRRAAGPAVRRRAGIDLACAAAA